MKVYKVIFVKNVVSSIELLHRNIDMTGDYFYECVNERLIYAIVKASNEVEARATGQQIIHEFLERNN